MNAEITITPIDRARIFMGKTSADEGFSTHIHVIREIALQGDILPGADYATLVGLYPIEGQHNKIKTYETRILSDSSDTGPVAAIHKRINTLTIPTNSTNPYLAQSHLDQPILRRQFELAAARLRQPSVIIALGKNDKAHNVSMFYVEGMTADKALSLIQHHLRKAQNGAHLTP